MLAGAFRRGKRAAIAVAGLLVILLAFAPLPARMSPVTSAYAQTNLRIFAGNYPKVDTLRTLANAYAQTRSQVTIDIETGGATLETQQQALNALLGNRDSQYDLILLDVLRVPQWAQAQWLEPLDTAFGADRDAALARLFPVYRQVAQVGGRLQAWPLSADAQALLMRADLLERHGKTDPVHQAALRDVAQAVLDAEKQANLRAIDLPTAAVESTVCSFLTALWNSGQDLLVDGKPALGSDAARRALQGLGTLRESRLMVTPTGEGHPERVRLAMQAGTLIFGQGWSYAFTRAQTDQTSTVAGKLRIGPMPGETAETAASCAGGWMIGVLAFSTRKAEAQAFIRYLATPEAARLQAEFGDLPSQTAPYQEPALTQQRPLLAQMGPVLAVARARPQTPRYSEVSEIIRTNVAAFMAGTKTADAALQDMQARLALIFR